MFDHFNLLAPIYDQFIKPKLPERIIELLDISTDQILLDVGGGTGRISQFFVDLSRQVIVADLAYQMLIKSQLKNGLDPVNSHSEYLPFPDDSFDRIVMVDALHHVCDQTQTARELWRVLKPGGKIVIEEPDIHDWGVKLVALGEKLALMRSHFLTGLEIQNLFSGIANQTQVIKEDHFIWVILKKAG
jgi:demethylmenaquinone methyltransferase/2-methoxy-6-polyprenyl-1,4-benzoquinol methylase